MRRFPSRYLKIHLGVLFAYILLALIMTFPLITKFSTHVSGDGIDAPPLVWNLWWVKHALIDLGRNPLQCNYLFYPIGINLAFYTLTVLNGALSIPLQSVIGLILANNLILLSSFALGGWGAFLLIEHLLVTAVIRGNARQEKRTGEVDLVSCQQGVWCVYLAAFIGGFVFAFSSSKLFFAALGQFNIASSQWVPYYILFLFRSRQKPQSLLMPALLALFLLLQTWAEMTYASFLILFTLFFFAYHFFSGKGTKALYGFFRNMFIVAVIFILGISPLLLNMLPDLTTEGDFLVEGTGFAETFSSDLLGLVIPTQLHPLMGQLTDYFNFPHDKGQHLFLGYVTLALALCGFVRWTRYGVVRFWGFVTFIFLLLAFGPVLRFDGISLGVPLLFRILQRIPFFNGNRYPGRISVMVVMGLAVLVAFGAFRLLRYVSQQRARKYVTLASIILVGLIGFENLSAPLPLVELRVPDVYYRIAEDREDVTLLDIPLAWRNGFRVTGTMDPIIMFGQFAQTVHQKRILAGNTSRNPEYKFQYFTELPVINSIIALETSHSLPPERIEEDVTQAASLLRAFSIRYVVVHPAQSGPDMVPYIETTMPVEKFYEDGELTVYRVDLPALQPEVYLDFGQPLTAACLGEGWGEAYVTDRYVWAQRDGALLMVPLNGGDKKLTFRVWSPGPRQVMRIELNGFVLPGLELAEGWGEYETTLPAESTLVGLNRLRLRFSRLFPVADVLPVGPPLGQSNISVPVNILTKSAGHEIGNFGHIYLNGKNVSLEGTGYNMVALDPETGSILDRQTFNTFSIGRASRDMADWIDALPEGVLVVLAVRDEASMHLTEEAVDALQLLGLEGDLRERFRWSHAAIGVKGLEPGQGSENIQALRPATVKLGLGVTEPRVAAAFEWMKFSAVENQ